MKKISLLLIALILPLLLTAKTVTVYHTSDTHGFFYPKEGQGGFAALTAVLKKGPQNYLLLDSGDFANGTIETKRSKGLKAVELMNAIGYDASTIGNHEFDFKDDAVAPMLEKADFPILAANFVEAGSLKHPDGVLPYQIFTRNEVKIAVIGLANRTPTNESKKYSFTKPLDALEQALNEVEKQHPQVVVVIVHDSLKDDKHGTQPYVGEIAQKYAGRVHLVLGGHAHKILSEKINGVQFAESGCYIQNVSKITIKTDDKTGKVTSVENELIPLVVMKTGEDEEIAKLADSLREPGVDEVVGTIEEPLLRKAPVASHKDTQLDNWVADLGKAYSGADVFIHNLGGTRVDMKAGAVTKRDLIDIHPFENTITQVTVNGRFLKRFVKTNLVPKNLYAYSGLAVTYKLNKKGKVKDLHIWVNQKPLKNRQKYTIATNTYIANGGSEGYLFKKIPDSQKKLLGTKTIRDLMEDGLRQGEVIPAPTGRVVQL